MKFPDYSPCIYKGKILCIECNRWRYCDMRCGRELHQKCFEAGYTVGYKSGLKSRDNLKESLNVRCNDRP